MPSEPLISIIVPVYNAERYLEACVSSLQNQTYRNLEIILVDDGATDGSPVICDRLVASDPRIKAFHKANEGSGATRNYGLEKIRGEYFLFVDSDDWLRNDAIALLYDKITREKAEIVYFDLIYYDQEKNEEKRSYENESYLDSTDFVREKLKKCTMPSTCTSIYQTKRWKESGLRFPACVYEDNEIYPKILIEFQRYAIVPEGLYYYRINTGKSMTQRFENGLKRTIPFEILMDSTRDKKEYKGYYRDLYNFCYHQLRIALNIIRGHLGEEKFCEGAAIYNRFLAAYFPKFPRFSNRYIYFGSYNIGRIGNRIIAHDINNDRFLFSGISALMNTSGKQQNLYFENEYRARMFLKEQNRELLTEIGRPYPKYLVFDLLEERCPVVTAQEGTYITGETPVLDCSYTDRFLNWTDEKERRELFQKGCGAFAEHCKRYANQTTFVMIRLYLAEAYGNPKEKKPYPNVEQIREINGILKGCYDYLESLMPGLIVFSPKEEFPEDYYTDESYNYGCRPEHLNNHLYDLISIRIHDSIVANVPTESD